MFENLWTWWKDTFVKGPGWIRLKTWRYMGYGEVNLDRERLEQIRGFLVYLPRTYKWMTPYLKYLHLTLDDWRPNRDTKTGWRLQYFHKDKDGDSWMTSVPRPDALKTVNPVVQFPFDV